MICVLCCLRVACVGVVVSSDFALVDEVVSSGWELIDSHPLFFNATDTGLIDSFPSPLPSVVQVYHQFAAKKRTEYPATLYVAVDNAPAPAVRSVSSTRPRLPTDREHGDGRSGSRVGGGAGGGADSDGEGGAHGSASGLSVDDERRVRALRQWPRAPGQRCRIPTVQAQALHAGASGCFALAYSPNGHMLAAACTTRDSSFPIRIHDPDGRLLMELAGHQDIVYDLSWSADSTQLLSASADRTVRLWDFGATAAADGSRAAPSTTFQHTSYVYAARFHPVATSPQVVMTGAFDGAIRVWSTVDSKRPLRTIAGAHPTTVNALAFSEDGSRMFSGDGAGVVKVWNCRLSEAGEVASLKGIKTVRHDVLLDSPINTLAVHPTEGRLLVHARDNMIVEIELKRYKIVRKVSWLEKRAAVGVCLFDVANGCACRVGNVLCVCVCMCVYLAPFPCRPYC